MLTYIVRRVIVQLIRVLFCAIRTWWTVRATSPRLTDRRRTRHEWCLIRRGSRMTSSSSLTRYVPAPAKLDKSRHKCVNVNLHSTTCYRPIDSSCTVVCHQDLVDRSRDQSAAHRPAPDPARVVLAPPGLSDGVLFQSDMVCLCPSSSEAK